MINIRIPNCLHKIFPHTLSNLSCSWDLYPTILSFTCPAQLMKYSHSVEPRSVSTAVTWPFSTRTCWTLVRSRIWTPGWENCRWKIRKLNAGCKKKKMEERGRRWWRRERETMQALIVKHSATKVHRGSIKDKLWFSVTLCSSSYSQGMVNIRWGNHSIWREVNRPHQVMNVD